MSTGERLMPRHAAISSASAGWVVPENTIIRLRVRMSRITGPWPAWPPRSDPSATVPPLFPSPPLAFVVARHDPLLGPLDGQRTRRHVLRDHRARSRPGALPDAYGRHQHRIGADVHLVPDHGPMFVEAVVVHGDRGRADVRVAPDQGVPDVGEVGDLAALPEPGGLDLDA